MHAVAYSTLLENANEMGQRRSAGKHGFLLNSVTRGAGA